MKQRDAIVAAVARGINTSEKISAALGVTLKTASRELLALRDQGRITLAGVCIRDGAPGRPLSRWRINPDYDPEPGKPVPAWVLPRHVKTYRSIARHVDEESAAKWARSIKRESAARSASAEPTKSAPADA